MKISGLPRTNAVVDAARKLMGEWDRWLQDVLNAVNRTAQVIASVALTGQSASIGITALKTPSLTAGLYRVNYAMRVAVPGAISSSLAFGIGWTAGGVSMTQVGAAITGNTTTTQQNGVAVILVDAKTTVSYATNYASAGATAMQYTLNVALEQLP